MVKSKLEVQNGPSELLDMVVACLLLTDRVPGFYFITSTFFPFKKYFIMYPPTELGPKRMLFSKLFAWFTRIGPFLFLRETPLSISDLLFTHIFLLVSLGQLTSSRFCELLMAADHYVDSRNCLSN